MVLGEVIDLIFAYILIFFICYGAYRLLRTIFKNPTAERIKRENEDKRIIELDKKTKICDKCRSEISYLSEICKYCSSIQAGYRKTCNNCNGENQRKFTKCIHCGSKLGNRNW
jgi:hypothetical protein